MRPLDPASPPSDGPGSAHCFAVLADERDIALIAAARGEWADRGTLEFAVGYSDKALSSRLGRLIGMGLIADRSASGEPRPGDGGTRRARKGTEYMTTPAGDGLLDDLHTGMIALAAGLGAVAGRRRKLLRAAAGDRRYWVVGRVVLYKPQSFTEVLNEARALGRAYGMGGAARLDHAGLTRRLGVLQELGLVARERSRDGTIAYARGPQMWRLARLAVEASLWCCLHTPERIPPLAGELLALVEMLADRVHVEKQIEPATVVLHVQPPAGMLGWLDATLEVNAGRIHVIRSGAARHRDAFVEAPLQLWCEALRSGDPARLAIGGDPAPALAVHAGIADALPPPDDSLRVVREQ